MQGFFSDKSALLLPELVYLLLNLVIFQFVWFHLWTCATWKILILYVSLLLLTSWNHCFMTELHNGGLIMVFCELGFAFSSRCVFSTHLGLSWFALDWSLLLVLYFGNLDLFISYLMVTISLKSLIYEEVGQQ